VVADLDPEVDSGAAIAAAKLPKRLLTVRSLGRKPAAAHESWSRRRPVTSTKRRTAPKDCLIAIAFRLGHFKRGSVELVRVVLMPTP
jgi:hypothetical protein